MWAVLATAPSHMHCNIYLLKRQEKFYKEVMPMATFKELRQQSGMNQTQFAKYFDIPLRTVQNWEGNINKCPEYLLKLMQYKLNNENKKVGIRHDA